MGSSPKLLPERELLSRLYRKCKPSGTCVQLSAYGIKNRQIGCCCPLLLQTRNHFLPCQNKGAVKWSLWCLLLPLWCTKRWHFSTQKGTQYRMLSSNPQKARTKRSESLGFILKKSWEVYLWKSVWWSICFKQESKVQTPSQRLSSSQLCSGTWLSCLPSSARHCAPRKG